MQLLGLELTNFKNIGHASLEFSAGINCFVGNNGQGKSNLLDAIHYLSFCRSFTGVGDSLLIRRGEDFALAHARYIRRGADEELSLGMARGRRKSLKRGGKEYARLSEHIGRFPLVMAAPSDIALIQGSGEERRRWMDMVISQGDAAYLDALTRYNNALAQRNRLLRDRSGDRALFEVLELTMDATARAIHARRAAWIDGLQQLFGRFYAAVAGTDEAPLLTYESALNESSMTDIFDRERLHDAAVGFTTSGVHRDDIDMSLDGLPMRRTGSQGQCKTFTVALRLAQWKFLGDIAGMKPMLLLDDIFDKLDADRVSRIMNLVADGSYGQIFVTDTNRVNLDSIIARAGGEPRLWNVAAGEFTPVAL